MHLTSALTCLRLKFRLGVISSFGLVSFRYFAWLFLSFWVAFSRHFVFSRRKDAITPREKKRNNQTMPLEIRRDEVTSDEKTKKSLMKRPKNKGFIWCYFAWPFFVLSCLFFVIYVISWCAICYFVFSPSVISSFLFFFFFRVAFFFCFISLALFCLFYRAKTPSRKTEQTK